jgi:flagellar basal-body rod modification protein FlgD
MIRLQSDLASTSPSASQPAKAPNTLGQKDFLQLLTAQMQNQDPLNPMQNSEFLGQMAQFSTVSGIDRLNDTVQGLGSGFRDMRLGMASNLVGQSVLVPGATVRPDRDGAYRGALTLEDPAQDVEIAFSDPATGKVLHRHYTGPQGSGQVPFGWDTAPAELIQSRHALNVTATLMQAGGVSSPVSTQVYARVQSASLGQSADDLTFQVEGFGTLHALEIDSLR